MGLKYFHQQPSDYQHGRTLALELPTKKEVITTLELWINGVMDDLVIATGVAKLNPEDKTYSKSIGRDVSAKCLKNVAYKIQYVESKENIRLIKLTNQEYGIDVTIRTHKNSDEVRIEYALL